MHSYARLSYFGILAIVLLRFGIGYHFYMEGASKVRDGNFKSEGFLKSAEGPLAGQFHDLIWDYDGKVRLDQKGLKKRFEDAATQTKEHFKLTDQQTGPLKKLLKDYLEKIDEAFAEGGDDINKYFVYLKKIEETQNNEVYSEVASLAGQKHKVAKEARASVEDTLASIDGIWKQYERRLNGVPSKEQFQAAGVYRFRRPGEGPMTSSIVDQIIPIFDMCVGILLMIGLLTPLVSFVAALFLLSVVLSQMPGFPNTAPTYFQSVEALGLLVLMATDAGRYLGLDFIPWAWWHRKPEKVVINEA